MPLLDILIPNAAADVVAVFDDSFNQVFVSARPIKATIREAAKLMEHPVETGVTITDHRVSQPVEIEISLLITANDFRSVYQQIKDLYEKGTLLTVQTRTTTHQNMIIQELPREESTDVFNGIALALKLKEALFVSAKYGSLPASKVKNKSQSSTVARGEQQTKDVKSESKSSAPSTFYKVFVK